MSSQPTVFGFDPATVAAFDKAYTASQPPCIQSLMLMDPTQPQRLAQAQTLANAGFFIDLVIMVWGWDPYMVMYQRQVDGYTSYPDMLNEQSKPVDLNPADYPPFAPPPPATTPLVGGPIGAGPYYFVTAALPAGTPAGTQVEQGGHTYILVYIAVQALTQTQFIPRWLEVS